MARVIDHSRNHRILEEELRKAQRIYPMPNLDEILPPSVYDLEEKLSEEEFDKFVLKHFNMFYSKYINSSVKDLFVNLPLTFFTKENCERVRWYVNIALDIKIESCNNPDDFSLPTSKKYYEDLHNRLLEMLKKKNQELIAKKKHEQTLYL